MTHIKRIDEMAINLAYEKILKQVRDVVSDTLCGNYTSDDIDMMYTDDGGYQKIQLFYHSRHNSYDIDGTEVDVTGIDIQDLVDICEENDIAFCQEK